MSKPIAIPVSIQLLTILFLFELSLVSMHFYQAETGRMTTLYNLDGDGKTLGQWFSASQLFCVGGLACLTAKFVNPPKWPPSSFMILVGVGFIFLSADEALGFHEAITRYTISYSWVPRFKGSHGVWIFAYGLVGILMLALTQKYIRILMFYHPRQSLMAVVGLVIFATGAVGVEVANYYSLFGNAVVQVALEEFLEMFGISIVLGAILDFFLRAVEQRGY